MEDRFDLIVIGSGPGGYVAAIKAAKLGMKTAIIEEREIGGTCLNRGCIPTKTLMHTSHLYYETQRLQEMGITVEGIHLDYGRLKERKEAVVTKMRQGILSLLEENQVTILRGRARITGQGRVIVSRSRVTLSERNVISPEAAGENSRGRNGAFDFSVRYAEDGNTQVQEEYELESDKILIAAGGEPVRPDIEGACLAITSDELLSMERVYQRLLIIGGGVIGIEFATLYQELGLQVEIIEAMDRILPGLEKEISQSIAMSLKKKGIRIHTGAKVSRIFETGDGALGCEYAEKGTAAAAQADAVLMAAGRRANTEGLIAEELPVAMDGAAIRVNEYFETSVPGIYAIGDAVRGKQLAHAASAQGIAAVEHMAGVERTVNLSVIPACVYTTPEAAVVGMSEEEAAQAGYAVKTGKYPMLGNGKTILSAGERGFIKVVSEAGSGRLLGAVLLCDRATDMVSEFAAAITNRLTVHDMASVIRPHPTYSEAVTEAVEDVEGMAIHLMPKR